MLADEKELIEAALAGDHAARNKVVMSIWPFINGQARKLVRRGEDASDLAQVGVTHVIEKFDNFDPAFGVKALTYFGKVAVSAMRTHRHRDHVIAPPHNVTEGNEEQVGRILRVASMNHVADDDGREFGDSLKDRSVVLPLEQMERGEELLLLRASIRFLPRTRRDVMRWRLQGDTLEAISQRIKCSKEWVRHLEQTALERLPELMKTAPATFAVFLPWRPEEFARLRTLCATMPIKQAARAIGRNPGSVYTYCQRQGITSAWHESLWTPEQDDFLRLNRDKGWQWCAKSLGRRLTSIYSRVKHLGIQKRMLNDADLALLRGMNAEGKTPYEISAALGVTYECIRCQLKKLHLKPNHNKAQRLARSRQTFLQRYGVNNLGELRRLRLNSRQAATLAS